MTKLHLYCSSPPIVPNQIVIFMEELRYQTRIFSWACGRSPGVSAVTSAHKLLHLWPDHEIDTDDWCMWWVVVYCKVAAKAACENLTAKKVFQRHTSGPFLAEFLSQLCRFRCLMTGKKAGGIRGRLHVKQLMKSYQCSHIDFVDRVCAHHRENTAARFHHHFPWDFTSCCTNTSPCCPTCHRVLAVGQQQRAAHVMRQPPQCHLSNVPVPGEQTAYQLNTKHLTKDGKNPTVRKMMTTTVTIYILHLKKQKHKMFIFYKT